VRLVSPVGFAFRKKVALPGIGKQFVARRSDLREEEGVGLSIGKSRGGPARAAIALDDMSFMATLHPDRPFVSIEDVVCVGS
jgi:hypothetical protein